MPPRILTTGDISLWLHNKLGSSDQWAAGSITSQLNKDILLQVKDCFHVLQSQVKLKLVLSMLHITPRSIEEWKDELNNIIELAIEDSGTDQWISMVAELLSKYPQKQQISFDISHNATVFTDLVAELRKIVRKHSDKSILPLECLYLNKNALAATAGSVPAPSRHFTLKRKSKSAALRAELLQKSSDAASTQKNRPVMGITSTRPEPITPQQRLLKPTARTLVRPPKRDSTIKMLDIAEQPRSEMKRKKKAEEKDEKPAEAAPTPDYAAGLTSEPASTSTGINVPSAPASINVQQQQQQPSSTQQQQQQQQLKPSMAPPPLIQPQQPQQQQQVPQAAQQQPVQATPKLQNKFGLSLEQQAVAQELFKNANKVGRLEKAWILGFLSGNRENPKKDGTSVLTIKLHEAMEIIDGVEKHVEIFFSMNYLTGEGKQIKRITA